MKFSDLTRNPFLPSLFIVTLLGFVSCTENACEVAQGMKDPSVQVRFERLEDQLDFGSEEDVLAFLSENRVLADYFLDAHQYPSDTILARRMLRLFQDPSLDSLIQESKAYFSDIRSVEEEFELAYSFIRSQYPNAKIPRVQTMVSGLYNDMYISDSLVVFGLDYFMGTQGTYHPNDIPMYIVSRYRRESVAPFVLSFISNYYNRVDDKHNTLLADMVNIGKSYYFVSRSLPCTPDSLIMGYTAEEMRLVRENQEIIWANLVENELLYESNQFIRKKFVGESPNVVEISEKCPGRVGAWVGWEIVKRYMDRNPDVSFIDLMNETDAHKIFQLSGYKPRNEP